MMKTLGNGLMGQLTAATKVAAFFFALGSSALSSPVQAAAQLTVNPVVLKLPAKALATSLKLENNGSKDAFMQAEIFAWSQPNGEDVLEPTREVLVSPPVFRISPGNTQIVRIGRLKPASPGPLERSYRVIISEYLPADKPVEGGISTLLKLSLPLFVPALNKQATALTWQAERIAGTDDLQLTVENPSNSSAKITALKLVQDGHSIASRSLIYPVLAGASRKIAWPKALVNAKPGQPLELTTDLGGGKFLRQALDLRVVSVVPLQ